MKSVSGIIALGLALAITPGAAFNSDAPASTANLPPNSISLHTSNEIWGLPIGWELGWVRATDPDDPNATGVYRFALVEGIGSSHNHLFSLDEKGVLKTAAVLDQETHDSLNIRIRVTDEHGAKLEKSYDLALVWNGLERYLDDTEEESPPTWARFLLGAFFCSPIILIFWILATGRKLGDYFGGHEGGSGGGGGSGCGGCGGGG